MSLSTVRYSTSLMPHCERGMDLYMLGKSSSSYIPIELNSIENSARSLSKGGGDVGYKVSGLVLVSSRLDSLDIL